MRNPRAVATPCRLHRRRVEHGPSKPGAARRATKQGKAGIEPALPWQSLRGKCFALHITGCCRPVPQSRAKRAWCGTATPAAARPSGGRQPPLCLAPLRACSAASWYSSPRSKTEACAAMASPSPQASKQGASRSHWVGPRPATHPPPKGAPQLPPLTGQRSAVLAASRVRGFAPARTARP